MKIIPAGGGKTKSGICYSDFCAEHGLMKLYSALTDKKYIKAYRHPLPLFVDSGAHSYNKWSGLNKLGFHAGKPPIISAKDHAKWYMKYIDANRDKRYIIVEFDAYGDLPIDTIDGMAREIMSMQGKRFKFIRVWHPGIDEQLGNEPLTTVKKWIYEDGIDYIGVSLNTYRKNLFKKFFEVILQAGNIKTHGFACTSAKILERYPLFSADSTTPLVVPYRYRVVPVEYSKMLTKQQAIKEKDIRYLFPFDFEKMDLHEERLIHQSLTNVKKAEEHYTKLWAARGIVYEDLF